MLFPPLCYADGGSRYQLNAVLKDEEGLLMPIMAHDIATMSFGYLGKRNKRGERTGGVMRGPMLATTLQQVGSDDIWSSGSACSSFI